MYLNHPFVHLMHGLHLKHGRGMLCLVQIVDTTFAFTGADCLSAHLADIAVRKCSKLRVTAD